MLIRNDKYYYQCVDCRREYPAEHILYLCPECEKKQEKGKPPLGVLKTLYYYDLLAFNNETEDIFAHLKQTGYIDLLPLVSIKSMGFLRVGNTPLYHLETIKGEKTDYQVFLKDDSLNPTFSFKDRASILVSAFAKEHGIDTIVAASTGNAGSSLAGICASQRQKAIIFVPAGAPLAKLTQILMYGARIIPVDGNYDAAFDLSVAATREFNLYNRNTAFNPLTIEGKKTVSFELYDQLERQLPDNIFIPVGDGVIISGVYKGFEDLMNLGIIDHIPTIIGVQSHGSDNLARNFHEGTLDFRSSSTIADSISVDIPRNFNMAIHYLNKYDGKMVTVEDHDILEASFSLSGETGIFSEPAAAAAYAGMLTYRNEGKMAPGSVNIVLLTGNGLKDLKAVQPMIKMPQPVNPELSGLKEILFG